MKFQSKFVATALALQMMGGIAQLHGLQAGPDEAPTTPDTAPKASVQYREPQNLAEDLGARLMGRTGKVPVTDSTNPSEGLMERQAQVVSMFAEPFRAALKFDARAEAELKREGFKDVEITTNTSSFTNIMTCTNVAGFVYPTSLPHQGLGFKAEAPDGAQVTGTVCFGITKKPLPVITKTLRGPMA